MVAWNSLETRRQLRTSFGKRCLATCSRISGIQREGRVIVEKEAKEKAKEEFYFYVL
jgi:hypothetical protein